MSEQINKNSLQAEIKSYQTTEEEIIIQINITNSSGRALHYISDVRACRYNEGSKTLTISLSDAGRQVIPGAAHVKPKFRYIDPTSTAEISIKVPNRIIKLSSPSSSGKLSFKKYELSELEKVEIEIAWADIPYYIDTRKKKDSRLPAERWEQYKAIISKSLKQKKK